VPRTQPPCVLLPPPPHSRLKRGQCTIAHTYLAAAAKARASEAPTAMGWQGGGLDLQQMI
jgi:hypothetical protein